MAISAVLVPDAIFEIFAVKAKPLLELGARDAMALLRIRSMLMPSL